MLLRFHLIHHICVSQAQPPTPTFQSPCTVVSLASTSLTWSNQTVAWLCPIQLLLPDCIAAPRVRPHHTHAIKSISTKVVRHYCSPTPCELSTSVTHTDTHAFKILMYWWHLHTAAHKHILGFQSSPIQSSPVKYGTLTNCTNTYECKYLSKLLLLFSWIEVPMET